MDTTVAMPQPQLSPTGDHWNVKPAAQQEAQTPNTAASSTQLSVDTSSTYSNNSGSSRSSGKSQYRVPVPSPSRSRLDRRYAQRLSSSFSRSNSGANPTDNTPTNATTSPHHSSLPPAAATPLEIFRPTPIIAPKTTSDSQQFMLDASPLRSYSPRFFRQDSTSSAASSVSGSSTPSRRQRHRDDVGISDRFIPNRATSSTIPLWDSFGNRSTMSSRSLASSAADNTSDASNNNSTTTADNTSNTHAADDTAGAASSSRSGDPPATSQQNLHNVLLRSELLGENLGLLSPSHLMATAQGQSAMRTPLVDGRNRLAFNSPRQQYQENMFTDTSPTSMVQNFSLTPNATSSGHRFMGSPQKRKRRIAKVPFKVLDAPSLADDFYLNLVDWSSQNVLAVGLGSCVYLWSACTSKVTKLCDLSASEDTITGVSWAQRGTHLSIGTNSGEVQLWDTVQCQKIRTFTGHSARVGSLAWTGPLLASGSRDRLIYLRDVRAQDGFTNRLSSHKQEVCGLKWSSDEPAFLASGGNDNQLHVVDSRNPSTPMHRFCDHTAAVKAISWSPHQHGLLASGGGTADRCIRFWNTLSGTNLNCIDTGSQVCNLAWSPNCNEIVSTHGYSLNQIVVWRYPSMSKVTTLTGHSFRVLYLAMSPDGSTIVTGAGDETLRFWQCFPGPRSDHKNSAGGLLFPNTLGSVIR